MPFLPVVTSSQLFAVNGAVEVIAGLIALLAPQLAQQYIYATRHSTGFAGPFWASAVLAIGYAMWQVKDSDDASPCKQLIGQQILIYHVLLVALGLQAAVMSKDAALRRGGAGTTIVHGTFMLYFVRYTGWAQL